MLLGVIIVLTITVSNTAIALLQSTKGSVWPKPYFEKREPTVYIFNPKIFKYTVTHNNCELVQKAISRCKENINAIERITKEKRKLISKEPHHEPENLMELRITLRNICEFLPLSKMNESYNLTVAAVSELTSDSVWGIIRGLESFSQLLSLTKDSQRVFVIATQIFDNPRYPHRGIMLDTSKNYVLVDVILKILDTMAMCKLNVFHWKIVDDQSLRKKDVMSYTKSDMGKIVFHAKDLGIRVVPEFNFPLHADPHYNKSQTDGGFLHPLKEETYKQLRRLYGEVQDIFSDQFLHVGDVNLIGWAENPEIMNYLKKHYIHFQDLSQKLLKKFHSVLKKGTAPIVWQSSKDVEKGLPDNFIVQTRKATWLHRGVEGLKRGRQVIFSIFLNQLTQMNMELNRFKDYYTADPREKLYKMEKNHTLEMNIIGQEAVIGTDIRNEYHLKSSSWLHISTIAEVLWSQINGTMPDAEHTLKRLIEQDCRMTFRGVNTGSMEACLNVEGIISESENTEKHPLEKTKEQRDLLEWGSLVYSLTSSSNQ